MKMFLWNLVALVLAGVFSKEEKAQPLKLKLTTTQKSTTTTETNNDKFYWSSTTIGATTAETQHAAAPVKTGVCRKVAVPAEAPAPSSMDIQAMKQGDFP